MIKFTMKHPMAAILKVYFRDKEILDTLAKLELENERVELMVLKIFYDMGIYEINSTDQFTLFKKATKNFIENSPEIKGLDQKIKHESALRKAKMTRRES